MDDARYSILKEYGTFRVVLFGTEGIENKINLKILLAPVPMNDMASGLEKHCEGFGIKLDADSKGDNPHNLSRYRYYQVMGHSVELNQVYDDEPASSFRIECRKGSLEAAVQDLKAMYALLSPYIQSLGYDTSYFDEDMRALTVDDFRRHPIHGSNLSGLGSLADDLALDDDYTPPERQVVSIGELLASVIELAGLAGFSCGYSREGTPDGMPSFYAAHVRQEAEKDRKSKRIPDADVDSLYHEAWRYSQRSQVFSDHGDFDRARMDTERTARILDYIISRRGHEVPHRGLRRGILNLRVTTESNLANIKAQESVRNRDFELALRYIQRATDFLKMFYSSIHQTYKVNEDYSPSGYAVPEVDWGSRNIESGVLDLLASAKKGVLVERYKSRGHDNSTEFSPSELTLDEQVKFFEEKMNELAKKELYKGAAKARDRLRAAKELLEKRQREDPLELERRYVLELR